MNIDYQAVSRLKNRRAHLIASWDRALLWLGKVDDPVYGQFTPTGSSATFDFLGLGLQVTSRFVTAEHGDQALEIDLSLPTEQDPIVIGRWYWGGNSTLHSEPALLRDTIVAIHTGHSDAEDFLGVFINATLQSALLKPKALPTE